jgi:GNAT superfamily N-acetyltransferase
MSQNQLPHQWETQQLAVRDATLDEADELQEINDALPSIEGWTGAEEEGEPSDSILLALTEGVLPPGGRKERFRLQSIRLRNTGEPVGFLAAYHGFPGADTFWVTIIALGPGFQGQGHGTELMGGLADVVAQLGAFTRMVTCVSLKNWPSLRLSVRQGFDRILAIAGDRVHSPGASAHITLERPLLIDEVAEPETPGSRA